MDKLFENKWAIRVISLIFAISLFLYVSIENNTTANTNSPVIPGTSTEVQVLEDVPLNVRIDADQYVVRGVPEYVAVSLEGRTSVLTPVSRQRNFKVFVDLRELSEGNHMVDIEYEGIPNDLKVYIEPKSIEVDIEKRAAEEFAIDVDLVNQDKLPLGYEIGNVEINPETVTVVSSQSVIDQIATVKVYVDVRDLKESIQNREVPISVYDIQGNDLSVRVDPGSVAISVQVERPSKKVPLTIATEGQLPDGLELAEVVAADEEIEIFGKRDVLAGIEEISTKVIDLSKIDKSAEHEVELDFPEGVTANNDKVQVRFNLDLAKTFQDISIDVVGNEKDTMTFVTPGDGKMDIIAVGSDKIISGLKKADIKASIEVQDMDAGSHKVDVKLTGPDGVTIEPEYNNITVDIAADEAG